MASGTNKNVAFIATIAVVVPMLIGAWFAAPIFLPMYRWFHVDLKTISRQTKIAEATLATQFKLKVRYNPRGEGDPVPWQIIDSQPAFASLYPGDDNDEEKLLVRCQMISANDGQSPSTTFINATYQDRYYSVVALRLPPGSLPGFSAKRPILVYNQLDLQKLNISEANALRGGVASWENDDEWPARDDGWSPPGAK